MRTGISRLATKASGAIAAAVITAGLQSAVAAEIKIAHFMPSMHPMDKSVMSPLAEEFNALTDGDPSMRIYPSGELGKGPAQQFKRVVTGVADIVFGIPGYTPNKFPKTELIHIPGLFANGADATNAIWDNIDLIEPEFTQAKLLGLWTNNPSVLLTREKPVRSLADMKGLKIRSPNPVMAELIKAWGAIPVSMPVTDVYNSMNTGVIDAVMIGPSGIRSYKLNETAKYVTTNIPTALDTFYLLMNKASWDKLSDDNKAKLAELTGRDMSLRGADGFFKAGQAGLKLAEESGVELIEIDEAADAEFRAKMAEPLEGLIGKRGEDHGFDAASVVSALGGN